MSQKLIVYLIGFALLLASGLLMAKDYRIEVIVFDKVGENTFDQSNASTERIAERRRRMTTLANAASTYETSNQLNQLESAKTSLLKANYRILATTSWQQPASKYENAPVISLGDINTTLTAGFIRIYTTALIYADLDLQLTTPAYLSADGVFKANNPRGDYFISEKRRLKFKQLHYFDHPYFGAILGVWPVKKE